VNTVKAAPDHPATVEYGAYFDILRRRSRIALLYRRFWLYPVLCRDFRGRVLDVGCGIGDLLRYRPGTTGVDVNPYLVDWCRSHGLDAQLMEPDRLPFGTGEFQGAMLDNVLEHLVDPLPLLREIRRVLAAPAVLVVGVPGKRGYEGEPDHKRYYDARGLGEVVASAGFRQKRLLRMPFALPGMEHWMKQYCLYGVFETR
jgi:SAM-dependent methyltransferase